MKIRIIFHFLQVMIVYSFWKRSVTFIKKKTQTQLKNNKRKKDIISLKNAGILEHLKNTIID